MYVSGMGGMRVGAGPHPLSMLTRQFPWISPGEVLADGAYSYRVLKRWDGGVRIALYDRGGIMVDSQDFFEPGVGSAEVFRGVGAAQVFRGVGAAEVFRGVGAAQVFQGMGGKGIFGGKSGIFGAMGATPAAKDDSGMPPGWRERFSRFPGQPNWGIFGPGEGIFGAMGVRPHKKAPRAYSFAGLGYVGALAGPLDPTSIGVRVVQRGLLAAGTRPSPGSADNVWGPMTEASLREWVTVNAGRLGADPARVLATLRDIPSRASSISLPNVLASRLEQLSGQYRSGGTSAPAPSPAPSPGAPSPAPGAPAPTGKPGAPGPGAPSPGFPSPMDMLPGGGLFTRTWMGAPVWVWGLAGFLVLGGGGYAMWAASKKKRRRKRPSLAAAAA